MAPCPPPGDRRFDEPCAHSAEGEVSGHRGQDVRRGDQPAGRAEIEHEDHDKGVEEGDEGEPDVRDVGR